MKSFMIFVMIVVAGLFAAVGCGTEESETETGLEVTQESSQELVTCPVTYRCDSVRPPGTGWFLTSTDFCPGTQSIIKCYWGKLSGGFTISVIPTASQCPKCVNNANGQTGTCGAVDPPATWTCSSP